GQSRAPNAASSRLAHLCWPWSTQPVGHCGSGKPQGPTPLSSSAAFISLFAAGEKGGGSALLCNCPASAMFYIGQYCCPILGGLSARGSSDLCSQGFRPQRIMIGRTKTRGGPAAEGEGAPSAADKQPGDCWVGMPHRAARRWPPNIKGSPPGA